MNVRVQDSKARYSAVAMTLHWLIAAGVVANIVIGLSMTDPDIPSLMALHKSIGFTVLVLSVLRLVWRWMNPVPPPPQGLAPWMRVSSRAMHFLFYFLIIATPLAGWLMVSVGSMGHPTSVFGLFNWPSVPILADMTRSVGHPYHKFFNTIHIGLAWAMIGLIPLHVGAALYHHFMRGDNVLLRMLPGARLRSGV
jgi:cytochrome b561